MQVRMGADSHSPLSCFIQSRAAVACTHVGWQTKHSKTDLRHLLCPTGDLFDGTYITGNAAAEMWEVETSGRKLLVEWGSELDDFDPVSQVLNRTVTINLMKVRHDSGYRCKEFHPHLQLR